VSGRHQRTTGGCNDSHGVPPAPLYQSVA
jgi:hypothetical protein